MLRQWYPPAAVDELARENRRLRATLTLIIFGCLLETMALCWACSKLYDAGRARELFHLPTVSAPANEARV